MVQGDDYRDVLRGALAQRRERNPQYSLRALARDLDVSPSRLSEVLRHRQRLSRKLALRVAAALGLAPKERDYFVSLVVAESGLVDQATRKKAAAKVCGMQKAMHHCRTISADELRYIGDPIHGILFEALDLDVDAATADGVESEHAQRFGFSVVEVRAAFERLVRLGLVRRVAGGYRKTDRDFATSTEIPSEVLRSAHRALLARAAPALDTQPLTKRSFHSLVVAIDSARLDEAKAKLGAFCRRFNEEFAAVGPKDAVYCLGMQFFALSKEKR